MEKNDAKFNIGQLILHKLYQYRGVIVDVDPCFMGEEEWYRSVAKTRPPKDAPWYRVLVHNSIHTTYVAEQNLLKDMSGEPIEHPDLAAYFSDFEGGIYKGHLSRN